jgi:hypothetical protein
MRQTSSSLEYCDSFGRVADHSRAVPGSSAMMSLGSPASANEADVPCSRVAAVLAINRLCAPGSELAIEERWYPSTALNDLLGLEEGKINDTWLYRCLDRILPHKTRLSSI